MFLEKEKKKKKMLKLVYYLLLVTNCFFLINSQSVSLENRRSFDTQIGVNLIANVNTAYLFPAVTNSNQQIVGIAWTLARQTTQSFKTKNSSGSNSLLISYPSVPRGNLSSIYNCLPNDANCYQINIPNFDISQVGAYSARYDILSQGVSSTTFNYNVSAFLNNIKLTCTSTNSTCFLNTSSNVLSVVADQSYMISCGINVAKNDIYPLSAQFNLMSDSYGEECLGMSSNLIPINNTFGYVSNYNLLLYTLNKSCGRTFSVQDNLKNYSCQLNPTPVSATETAQYQTTQMYSSMNVVLDVQYGPDATLPMNPIPQSYYYLFNKTIMVGSQVNFTCPFMGNPMPNYYWRVVDSNSNASSSMTPTSDFSLSSQDYTVSRNLQVGTYTFECKAQVLGLVNNFSQPIQFTLTVIRKLFQNSIINY